MATIGALWSSYRRFAKTSRRMKSEQGRWRHVLLLASIVALLATPFAESLKHLGYSTISAALAVIASVLFGLIGWLHESVLGEDSQQPWVRARQAAEGLKALSFRYLGGVPPFDRNDAHTHALNQAQEITRRSSTVPDPIDGEAMDGIPPVPLTVEEFLELRVRSQINFYDSRVKEEQVAIRRIVALGRTISLAVVVFGALGAWITSTVREIWAPALGAASALVTTQMAVSRRRFLVETYSLGAEQLRFAEAAWNASGKTSVEADGLILAIETALATENAGWVQQMLLKPVVPDQTPVKSTP